MRLIFPQAIDLAWNDQVSIAAQGNAVLDRKPFRALRHKVHVRTLAQDLARHTHRMTQMFYAADTPGGQGSAVHDQGIELHLAITIQKAAASGVEGLIIFQDDDRLLDRVERGATTIQDVPGRSGRIAHTIEMSLDHFVRNGPGAAMDKQNRISRQAESPTGNDGIV